MQDDVGVKLGETECEIKNVEVQWNSMKKWV